MQAENCLLAAGVSLLLTVCCVWALTENLNFLSYLFQRHFHCGKSKGLNIKILSVEFTCFRVHQY